MVWSFGGNDQGQCGVGSLRTISNLEKVKLPVSETVTHVDAWFHTLIVTSMKMFRF